MTHHEGNDNGRDGLAIFGAMVLGALFGGLAALLLAPKSGPELREDIGDTANSAKEKAEDLKDTVTSKYQSLKDRVDEHLSEHKEQAVHAAEELCEKVEEQVEEA